MIIVFTKNEQCYIKITLGTQPFHDLQEAWPKFKIVS